MRDVVVFDDGLGLLSPLTDLRAAFEVRTGAFTLVERLGRGGEFRVVGWECAEGLRGLVRERMGVPWVGEWKSDGAVLLVNGRCPLVPVEVGSLRVGQALVEKGSGHVIAAHVEHGDAAGVMRGEVGRLGVVPFGERALMARPWDVKAFRDRCVAHDLALLHRLSPKAATSGGTVGGAMVAPTARVHESAILDAESGPIFVDEHAVVRPGAILVGPVYVGPHSVVLERALIKGNTAIGPWCKVAGEVGGTIFQGYANKSHEGHLGDSWVGEWANLGAGTTNSNLLNTYGDVIARPLGSDGKPGANERTGEQFLGAVIGDHVKTAICTRIMTGAIVGTGTMFAASGALSGTVPALSWITDSGTRVFAMEKFVEIARVVMGRRKVGMTAAYEGRLRALAGH